MALHRDIYWVGRQWAVTGYGIQACNQKQKGKFDIEAARLWEHGVLESIRAEPWLNVEDFDKALDAARKYYPEPPRKAAPPEPRPKAAPVERRPPAAKQTRVKEIPQPAIPIEAPQPAVRSFDMRIESWPAKFIRPWRVRIRR
jgi:hypothetical protein